MSHINFTLTPERLAGTPIPLGTTWLLGACMEARGKQDLWKRQKPETLAALREQAMVQSVESSNRIEGVTIAADRLRPIVLDAEKPRDRSEEELAGYRRALHWIYNRKGPMLVTPEIVRRLHAYAQGGYSGDAGSWKKRDNEIIEIRPNGERRVRFTPTPARDTPRAVTILCRNYQELCVLERIPILLTTATFVFDFLCIHPFRDGNGRVSRLLTTLLLQSNGFDVARYISLERQVEERKEEYYNALEECSARWNEGKNSIIPWWNYFLGVVRAAYREFEKQIELAGKRPVKTEMIRQIVLDQAGEFTLSDIAGQVPAASPQLIKKVLSELKAKHGIRLRGRGRGAAWEVIPRRTTARAR